MKEKEINVCITTNLNYLKYAASFIESLISHINYDYNYNLFIFTNKEISWLDKLKLFHHKCDCLKIFCIEFDETIFENYKWINLKSNWLIKWNYTYFYRWFIDKYIDANRVIYFDTDMIINWDIVDLYNIDLWDNVLWAVKDIFYMDSKLNREYKIEKFFNSWMLLINLKKWKENNIWEKCLNFKNKHLKETLLFDQDTLNIVLKDNRLCLSPKRNSMEAERFQYKNIQYTKDEFMDAKRPNIIHYTGFLHRPRSWIICLHTKCFLYYKYLRRTKYWDNRDILIFLQRCITSNCVSRFLVKTLMAFLYNFKNYLGQDFINKLVKKVYK